MELLLEHVTVNETRAFDILPTREAGVNILNISFLSISSQFMVLNINTVRNQLKQPKTIYNDLKRPKTI